MTKKRRYHQGPLPDTRVCVTCEQEKPLNDENFYRHNYGGFRHECVACRGMAAIAYNYGVSKEEYMQMLKAQGGVCLICKGLDRGKRNGYALSVDHCHTNGHIRGLLCSTCNLAIGYLNDDPELCRRAATYLEERS